MSKKSTSIILMLLVIAFIVGGCNKKVDIIKIDVENLNSYYLEQLTEDGAYLMYGDKNQKAVAFVSSNARIVDVKFETKEGFLSVYYYTKNADDGESLYKYAYVINNIDTDSINVYLNDDVTYFVNIITSDEKIEDSGRFETTERVRF